MKNFLLALFPNLTAKAAVTAAVCVTAGAAVTATATTVVYNHKTEQYKKTIDRLEEESAQNDGGTQNSPTGDDTTAVRVVDGRVEVWDGDDWVDYGSVDEVASKDPYYENESKREETEKNVAAKKLAELGYAVDASGKVVKLNSEENNGAPVTGNTIPVLVGNTVINNVSDTNSKKSGQTANSSATSNSAATTNSTAAAAQTPAGTIPVVGLTPTISSIPDTSAPNAGVTNVSWTAEPSSSGSSYDPYGESSGGSSDSSESSGSSGSSGSSESSGSSGSSESSGSSGSESSQASSSQSESSSTPEPSGTNESTTTESSGEGDGFSEEVE
ncbi:MAG: hypothetical protein K6F87_09640 [Lachnospiraceae bacterium]|nr:hypothetical protein [Lachnospiraceae bacterium]